MKPIWKPLLYKNGKYITEDENINDLQTYISNKAAFNTLLDILYPEEKGERDDT